MICYKDRTWCSQSDDCANETCSRNLTPEESKKADEWWGEADEGGAPIAFADFYTPDCGFVERTT